MLLEILKRYNSHNTAKPQITCLDHRIEIMLKLWIIYWNKVKLYLLVSISVTSTHNIKNILISETKHSYFSCWKTQIVILT